MRRALCRTSEALTGSVARRRPKGLNPLLCGDAKRATQQVTEERAVCAAHSARPRIRHRSAGGWIHRSAWFEAVSGVGGPRAGLVWAAGG